MHAWLRDLAIRKKVALIVTLTTAVALLLASTVFVVYDLVSFRAAIVRDLTIKADMVGTSSACALALALSSPLQRALTAPLLGLAAVARTVSVERNYAIRAIRATGDRGDETGVLVRAFNDMLAQIERRDEELRQHHERLEAEVA